MTKLDVVGGAILNNGRVLGALRSSSMSTPNRWEFPGGKVEGGETHAAALRRELKEELGVDTSIGALLGTVLCGRIQLTVYLVTILSGEPTPCEHAELRWLNADELNDLDWAEADIPLLAPLLPILNGLQ